MPDISMCDGKNCNKKDTCYRFTAKPSKFMQSWFTNSPVDEEGDCEYYWKNK